MPSVILWDLHAAAAKACLRGSEGRRAMRDVHTTLMPGVTGALSCPFLQLLVPGFVSSHLWLCEKTAVIVHEFVILFTMWPGVCVCRCTSTQQYNHVPLAIQHHQHHQPGPTSPLLQYRHRFTVWQWTRRVSLSLPGLRIRCEAHGSSSV